MNSRKGIRASLRWIFYVSRRFSQVDTRGRSSVTSRLASLGIAFGVMALIVVMGVMNGFQREFIDAVMEISSYHLQVRDVADEAQFLSWCDGDAAVRSATPFYEAQGLLVQADSGREAAALLRALPEDVMDTDAGFRREVRMISGSFDISGTDTIVLGYDLAVSLRAGVGDTITVLALGGTSASALFDRSREFTVSGIFYANYQDINAAYAFINLAAGKKYFGADAARLFGIKLASSGRDAAAAARLSAAFPGTQVESWRSYNRTFFGALRIEKNMLLLLVFLIFVVVAVNIYNGMRRMMYERREEIAVLSALGASRAELQAVFAIKGGCNGLAGSSVGLVLGLFICVNMKHVFLFLAGAQYWCQCFAAMLLNPRTDLSWLQENPMFRVYASVPARIFPGETAAVFLFGFCSALAASWIAGRRILKLTVSEVLRDE
ncbi:MAG: ABC transporter permease [Treponema sp.]|nr:ABC transporter permease [Treponema sp.]